MTSLIWPVIWFCDITIIQQNRGFICAVINRISNHACKISNCIENSFYIKSKERTKCFVPAKRASHPKRYWKRTAATKTQQSRSYNLKIPIQRGEKVVMNTVFPIDWVLGSEINLNKFDQIWMNWIKVCPKYADEERVETKRPREHLKSLDCCCLCKSEEN